MHSNVDRDNFRRSWSDRLTFPAATAILLCTAGTIGNAEPEEGDLLAASIPRATQSAGDSELALHSLPDPIPTDNIPRQQEPVVYAEMQFEGLTADDSIPAQDGVDTEIGPLPPEPSSNDAAVNGVESTPEIDQQEAKHGSLNQTLDSTTRFGLAVTTVALGVLSVMAAVRGVVKGSIEVNLWWKSLKRFSRREFTDMAACNAYSLVEQGDRLILEGETREMLALPDLFGNRGGRLYFLKAAKRCTHEQPLVCLEFPRDIDENALLKKAGRLLMAPLHYLTARKMFPDLDNPPDPNLKRYSALNRINKCLREAVSAIYNKSSIGMTAKQFGKEFPLNYYEGALYVIPICDVSPPDDKNGMTLALNTLTEHDFELFGDPEQVARMEVSGAINPNKIATFVRAYQEHQDYLRYRDRHGKPQQLFPRVRVYIAQQVSGGSRDETPIDDRPADPENI